MTKAKQYVFTINNPLVTIQEQLDVLRAAGAVSAIIQLEKGENGTPHHQGYVRFENARQFKAMVKLLTTQAHIEAAKCSFAAWTYCSKTDTRLEGPVHFGEVPKPKKKKA